MKFGLISHVLPPSLSGQAMVLFRLLSKLPPESYCLMSQVDYSPDGSTKNYSQRMAGKYFRLSPEFSREGVLPRGSRFGFLRWARRFRFFRYLNLLLNIFRRGIQISQIIKREECDKLVACTDHFYDPPAGYLASRLAGAKFYAYIFDDYLHKWEDPDALWLARRLGPWLLKRAEGVIVPNEFTL